MGSCFVTDEYRGKIFGMFFFLGTQILGMIAAHRRFELLKLRVSNSRVSPFKATFPWKGGRTESREVVKHRFCLYEELLRVSRSLGDQVSWEIIDCMAISRKGILLLLSDKESYLRLSW